MSLGRRHIIPFFFPLQEGVLLMLNFFHGVDDNGVSRRSAPPFLSVKVFLVTKQNYQFPCTINLAWMTAQYMTTRKARRQIDEERRAVSTMAGISALQTS